MSGHDYRDIRYAAGGVRWHITWGDSQRSRFVHRERRHRIQIAVGARAARSRPRLPTSGREVAPPNDMTSATVNRDVPLKLLVATAAFAIVAAACGSAGRVETLPSERPLPNVGAPAKAPAMIPDLAPKA